MQIGQMNYRCQERGQLDAVDHAAVTSVHAVSEMQVAVEWTLQPDETLQEAAKSE